MRIFSPGEIIGNFWRNVDETWKTMEKLQENLTTFYENCEEIVKINKISDRIYAFFFCKVGPH